MNLFINALYTASTVVVQKSLREGFGLTLTEAMWKKKAVVAGITSGTVMQVKNRRNGCLTRNIQETAKAIDWLLAHPKIRQKLGNAAHQSVLRRFLIPKLILENLKIYNKLSKY